MACFDCALRSKSELGIVALLAAYVVVYRCVPRNIGKCLSCRFPGLAMLFPQATDRHFRHGRTNGCSRRPMNGLQNKVFPVRSVIYATRSDPGVTLVLYLKHIATVVPCLLVAATMLCRTRVPFPHTTGLKRSNGIEGTRRFGGLQVRCNFSRVILFAWSKQHHSTVMDTISGGPRVKPKSLNV